MDRREILAFTRPSFYTAFKLNYGALLINSLVSLIKPVFYNHIDTELLGKIIDGDHIVRIEGPEKRVNYSRVDDPTTAC